MRSLNLERRHANKPGAVERAAAALGARVLPAKPPLTMIEARCAALVSLGLDPWEGRHGNGSRTVSQAVSRLRRKAYLAYSFVAGQPDRLTDQGIAALETTFRWALHQGVRP